MFKNSKKNLFISLIKSSVSLLLLYFILKEIELNNIIDIIFKANTFFLVIAVIFQVLIILIQTIRWRLFFPSDHAIFNFVYLFKIFFIGIFFNNILPTSSGGDGVRAYYIYKRGASVPLSTSPIIIERMAGLFAMIGMASLSITFVDINAEWVYMLRSFMLYAFIVMTLMIILLRWQMTYRMLYKFLKKISRNRIIKILLNMTESINQYLNKDALIIKVFLISISAQIIQIFVFLFISYSLGIEFSLFNLIFAVPIVLIAAGLPISIGGFGVREVAIISVFSAMGISNIEATSIAIIFMFIIIISSLPGLYFFINNSKKY